MELKEFQEKLTEWRNQWCRVYDLKAELKAQESALRELEDPLLEEISEAGGVLKTLDGKTVSVRTTEWAGVDYKEGEETDEGYERACAALEKAGLPQYVMGRRFNVQSLSALVREMARRGEPLPPEFDGVIKVTEKSILTTRRH